MPPLFPLSQPDPLLTLAVAAAPPPPITHKRPPHGQAPPSPGGGTQNPWPLLSHSRSRGQTTPKSLTRQSQDSCRGVEDLELKEAIFREVASPLLSIARRHEGYQTLWHMCYDHSDTTLLRNLMHESVGPKGGFSYFVFKQLIGSRQYAKLLRLGEEFQEELASFLKEHKNLLWLHEIFLNQFACASETLHSLALSQDDSACLIFLRLLQLQVCWFISFSCLFFSK